jgi:hypothetical protein
VSPDIILSLLPEKIQTKYLLKNKKTRTRLFTPRLFFESLICLVAGKNKEGYISTLLRTFRQHGSVVPSSAAFCKIRKRVSWKFFHDLLFLFLNKVRDDRGKYHGFYVYATDGFETEIPRSNDVLKAGYSGRSLGSIRQTYYPRMYMVHTWDVINGITKDIYLQTDNQEIEGALDIIPRLETNSISLYDRLYFCRRLLKKHTKSENYFIARCKTEGGHKEIVQFAKDNTLRVQVIEIDGIKIKLFKIANRKTKQVMVLATNLFFGWVDHNTVYKLYITRWEVETSFKDFVMSMKIEDFHAKDINGILQEVYARLWLMNFTRILILKSGRVHLNPEERNYQKPNYKILYSWVSDNLKKIFDGINYLWNEFVETISITMQKRKRRSRRYPRELKYSGKMYPRNSTIVDFGGNRES